MSLQHIYTKRKDFKFRIDYQYYDLEITSSRETTYYLTARCTIDLVAGLLITRLVQELPNVGRQTSTRSIYASYQTTLP
jgi:hypothetical protein